MSLKGEGRQGEREREKERERERERQGGARTIVAFKMMETFSPQIIAISCLLAATNRFLLAGLAANCYLVPS